MKSCAPAMNNKGITPKKKKKRVKLLRDELVDM
jgi:hypothetical protein